VVLDAEPRVFIGFHKPTILTFEDYVFDIIDALLSSGRTSRLYKALIVQKKLATSISTGNGFPGARYPNLFIIEALPRKPHSCAEVTDAIYQEIERLKREPIAAKELQKIKNQLQADFIRGLKNNDGLASQLSYYQIICNNWRYLEQHMAMIDKITPRDVQRIAAQYLHAGNRTVARLISSKKAP
jgi:predicted Zn-dependent peptidase